MNYKKTTLDNGVRVITVPVKDATAVTVLVMVETGSKYETKEESGISHFLEHMMFKGTPRRPKAIDIVRELDTIGAGYNAFTSFEYTGYYAKSHPKHLDKIMDVVSDMYLNPLFEEAEIKKERGVILAEIDMYEDLPQRKVQDLFTTLLYGDQPAGRSILGNKETLEAMDRETFLNYRDKHYVAEATTLVVSGDIDEASVIKKAEKLFKNIPTSTKSGKDRVVEKQDSPKVLLQYKETDQAHLVLGVRSFDVHDKRVPALEVLNAVLGSGMSSRLFQKLRDEMGVAYYVRAGADELTDHGIYSVSAGVDTSRIEEVLKAILDELKKMRDVEVGDDELKKAKEHIIGSLSLSLETSSSQAMYYADQEIMHRPLEKPEEYAEKIRAITADDIMNVAKDIFNEESLNLALIGRFKDEGKFKEILKLQ